MSNYRKIIEALDYKDRMDTPLRQTAPKTRVEMQQSIPDYNIGILIFNDMYHSVEIALTDKETGNEFCRHVFDDMKTLNAFISEAFFIKDLISEADNRNSTSVKIIEHKLKK